MDEFELARQLDRDIVNAHFNAKRWHTDRIARGIPVTEGDVVAYELSYLRTSLEGTMALLSPSFAPSEIGI